LSLGVVLGVLHQIGRETATVYMLIFTGGVIWHLTRLHGIRWHDVPRLSIHYLLGRSSAVRDTEKNAVCRSDQ